MPLTISSASLDWALNHAIKQSDTDIFPRAFEFEAISGHWAQLKKGIQDTDVSNWTVRAQRRCLAPKHKFGFRISTQLDPLDFLVYTALIYEIGSKLEKTRVPATDNIVHSYRFSPNADGRMFSEQFTYRSFQKTSQSICQQRRPRFVAIADIADFFPRLYTHRVDNALDAALGPGHLHGTALKHLIGQWAGTYSYGIPVGSAASRLIAETAISDIDQALLSEGIVYVRYSDDFRFFCSSEAEAYKCLTLVARYLIENHGLTLQQHKTKIVTIKKFKSTYLRENEKREIDTLSERFRELIKAIGLDDVYEDIDVDSLDEANQELLEQLNLRGILEEQLKLADPDLSLLKFLLRRLGQIGSSAEIDLVLKKFNKFVPAVREAVEFILQIPGLPRAKKAAIGKSLLKISRQKSQAASHLEYSRMYLLHPFATDESWNNKADLPSLYGTAVDEFSQRELILALGKSKQAFWFRTRKQSLMSMPAWVRRAFLYAASCLPADEYKHWIRGLQQQLDPLEQAIGRYGLKCPI